MNTSPSIEVHPTIEVNDIDLPQTGRVAIIPAFNHERVIGSIILQTKQHVERIIVVDDGSSDRTHEVAKLAGAEVIRLDYSTGKAYALLLGLRHANELKCKVAVTLDASGKHDPMEIERVIGQIINGKADLVIGSRYLKSLEPLLPHEKYNRMTLESGTTVTDSSSTFMAFSRKALSNLDFPSEGLKINRDLISFFDKQGLKISEISITFHKRQIEYSSWDFSIKVLAAMPAYNEEKFIAKTIFTAQQYVDCVLVVDDGSTDATREISKKMGAMVVSHQKNFGYGSALRTIFEKAKKLDIDALVIFDSDGQHDPKDIPRLLYRLGKGDVDVVIGSRFLQGKQQEIPGYRIFGMKVLDQATKIAGADNTTDSQSGFRAYGKKAIKAIQISKNGMSAGSEILIQIAENKLRIAEIPIIARYDIEETSSQNPLKHGVMVLYNIIGLISYRRPLPAFGIPGVILVMIGFIFVSWAIKEYYSTATFPFVLSMASGIFVMMGLLLIIAAVILNFLVLFVTEQKKKMLNR
jgi:glycosyltransferase involved in cell wall biosynthesis